VKYPAAHHITWLEWLVLLLVLLAFAAVAGVIVGSAIHAIRELNA
jgi:hypothetical protein